MVRWWKIRLLPAVQLLGGVHGRKPDHPADARLVVSFDGQSAVSIAAAIAPFTTSDVSVGPPEPTAVVAAAMTLSPLLDAAMIVFLSRDWRSSTCNFNFYTLSLQPLHRRERTFWSGGVDARFSFFWVE